MASLVCLGMCVYVGSCILKSVWEWKLRTNIFGMILVCRHLGRWTKARGAPFHSWPNPPTVFTQKRNESLLQRAKWNFQIFQPHWHILPFLLLPASLFLLKEDEQVLHLAQWCHNESDWTSECYSLLITTPFTPSMYQFFTLTLHVWERKIDQGKRKSRLRFWSRNSIWCSCISEKQHESSLKDQCSQCFVFLFS